MNLILLEPEEMLASGGARLTDARAAHLLKVVKVRPGSAVRVGIVDGSIGVGTVQSTTGGIVTLHCVFDGELVPRPRIDLLLALPRPKVMRRLWAQIAALGVGRIVLTNAERVERDYFDTHVLARECYRPLLLEGLQQARDTRLPDVSIHRQFKVLIEDDLDRLSPESFRLVAHPTIIRSAADALRDAKGRRILLAIGPEGGWNAFELGLLEAHGFAAIGMGRRTLRSDTACIALLALVHELDGWDS